MAEPEDLPPPPKPRVAPTERVVLERVRPVKPGDAVVRRRRLRFEGFERTGEGHLEASPEIERPRGPLSAVWRFLVGAPIHSQMEGHERLPKKKALAVFSSDALSSVAYTPQETLIILLTAGTVAVTWSLPIAVAVVLLLATVITSYRQTIYAYPTGGGSYIVAHGNLGRIPGLIAASALLMGYILTVSVSIASAADQLISAVQPLAPYRVPLGVLAVILVTLANLRGLRESGNIFMVPTYVFLVAMYTLVGVGLVRLATGTLTVPTVDHHIPPEVPGAFSLFLLLRAFAVASAVMTGTEAISDGVLAFKPPEPRNAATTLVAMGLILGTMFLGLSVLIVGSRVIPTHEETVISLLARGVFGEGPLYYVVQASAVLILVLAANTAYADFPRLGSFLARDHYAPHQFAFRGDRLAFQNGILVLGIASSALIVLFGGSTGALLPLYALSVFMAFTFSQAGMVRHWWRERGPHWKLKIAINGVGATVTGGVALIAGATNFMNPALPIVPGVPIGWGSWLVFIIVPFFIWLFLKVHRHYADAAAATALPSDPQPARPIKHSVVVPISRLNWPTVRAVRYATALGAEVTAVHVASDLDRADTLEREWKRWFPDVPMVVVESPYRSLISPLLRFLAELKKVEQADVVTVVLPEYVPDSLWEHALHAQHAQLLKLTLLFTPGFVVTSVPTHERAPQPASPSQGG